MISFGLFHRNFLQRREFPRHAIKIYSRKSLVFLKMDKTAEFGLRKTYFILNQ